MEAGGTDIARRAGRPSGPFVAALKPISDLRERPIPPPFAVVFLSVVPNEGQPVGR